MKKKVTFLSGKSRLVNYQEQKVQIANLESKMNTCMMHRDYMGVQKYRALIDDAKKNLEYLEKQQILTLGDLTADMDEKVRLKFSASCVEILLLADMLDSVATDLQDTMRKMGAPAHLNVMHAVKAIKENATAFVRMLDGISTDDESVRFGEFSDSVMRYVEMRANTYAKNERRRGRLKL